jgi:hypothetical protein
LAPRNRFIEFRERCMERVRIVRSFDEAGGGHSPDRASQDAPSYRLE